MMGRILISVRPEYFTMIYLKKKIFELRKSYPKEADAKDCDIEVLVYCCGAARLPRREYLEIRRKTGGRIDEWEGKVAAAFALRQVYSSKYVSGDLGNGWQTNECPHHEGLNRPGIEKLIGVSLQDAERYAGTGTLYLWRIDDFRTLERPRGVSEFGLRRPPQSWCRLRNNTGGAA